LEPKNEKKNFRASEYFSGGRLLQRDLKMSEKIESKWKKKVSESTELENCEFRMSAWYKKHRHCCARRRCYKKFKAFEIQSLRKNLLKLESLAEVRLFLAHFQDLDSRPILRVIPSDVKQVSLDFNDDCQNLEVVSVCHAFFKWVWGVSNSFLADERKDKRKLRV